MSHNARLRHLDALVQREGWGRLSIYKPLPIQQDNAGSSEP